jgi:hypothetical protein
MNQPCLISCQLSSRSCCRAQPRSHTHFLCPKWHYVGYVVFPCFPCWADWSCVSSTSCKSSTANWFLDCTETIVGKASDFKVTLKSQCPWMMFYISPWFPDDFRIIMSNDHKVRPTSYLCCWFILPWTIDAYRYILLINYTLYQSYQ